MPRNILAEAHIYPAIRETVANHGADIIGGKTRKACSSCH